MTNSHFNFIYLYRCMQSRHINITEVHFLSNHQMIYCLRCIFVLATRLVTAAEPRYGSKIVIFIRKQQPPAAVANAFATSLRL